MTEKAEEFQRILKRLDTPSGKEFELGQWVYYAGRKIEAHGWHRLREWADRRWPLLVQGHDTYNANGYDGRQYPLLHPHEAEAFGFGTPPIDDKAPVRVQLGSMQVAYGFYDAQSGGIFSINAKRTSQIGQYTAEPITTEFAHQVWGSKEAYEAARAKLD